jgi:hypothetical protein
MWRERTIHVHTHIEVNNNNNNKSILFIFMLTQHPNSNSIQLSSILYYLRAEPTATRPITDTAQCRYK